MESSTYPFALYDVGGKLGLQLIEGIAGAVLKSAPNCVF